jgi:hypothetical protein
MIGRQSRPCMNLCGMYRCFGVVPQGLVVFFPVVLGGDFRSPLLVVFLGILWGKFVGTLRGSLGCGSPPKFVS